MLLRTKLFKYVAEVQFMAKFCFLIAVLWAIPAFAKDYLAIVDEGRGLRATDADSLEKVLAQNAEDLAARAHVIGYYYGHPEGSSRRSRLLHIGWLIEHHPDSAILSHYAATMIADDFKPPFQGDLPAMAAAWQRQVNAHPDDSRVIANALNGVIQVD
jgi:hypothetical protein